MKVLIITGKLASNLVKRESAKSKHDVHVHVVKTPIAAFLTPKKIVEEIKKYGGYDLKTDTSEIYKSMISRINLILIHLISF